MCTCSATRRGAGSDAKGCNCRGNSGAVGSGGAGANPPGLDPGHTPRCRHGPARGLRQARNLVAAIHLRQSDGSESPARIPRHQRRGLSIADAYGPERGQRAVHGCIDHERRFVDGVLASAQHGRALPDQPAHSAVLVVDDSERERRIEQRRRRGKRGRLLPGQPGQQRAVQCSQPGTPEQRPAQDNRRRRRGCFFESHDLRPDVARELALGFTLERAVELYTEPSRTEPRSGRQ